MWKGWEESQKTTKISCIFFRRKKPLCFLARINSACYRKTCLSIFLFLASFGKDVERMGRFSKVTTKFFLDTTLDPVFIPLEGKKMFLLRMADVYKSPQYSCRHKKQNIFVRFCRKNTRFFLFFSVSFKVLVWKKL
jgi:hypothetical protein